jgi:hypothetical protein
MINHLCSQGKVLDFVDTKTLLVERDAEWDASEAPKIYVNRFEKAIKGLNRAGIVSDLNERRDMALYHLKASGEFDAAIREWEQKPAASKTWTNIKSFIATEYARENKQIKLTTKQYKANALEEQAEATDKFIANLTESHTHQMEILIKSTTEGMKEMMTLVKSENRFPTNNNELPKEGKRKKRDKKSKLYHNAPICKHCNKKHPAKKEEECWELEANTASVHQTGYLDLKVRGASRRSRDMATRQSVVE